MKRAQILILSGLLCAAGSAAAATNSPVNPPPKVLPVLVQVNASGKVTNVSPAVELRPKLTRLLRQTLDKMIVKPASADGHAVASQFVINLAITTTPRKDGNYGAQFTYVSAKPIPFGTYYWVHQRGQPLALAPQGSQNFFRHRPPTPHYNNNYNNRMTNPNHGTNPPANNPPPQSGAQTMVASTHAARGR